MTNQDHPSPLDWREYVEMNPRVADGKPVVKGTTLTVESIFQELATGQSISSTIERHSELNHQIVQALFALVAQSVHTTYPGPTPDDFYDGPEWTIVSL